MKGSMPVFLSMRETAARLLSLTDPKEVRMRMLCTTALTALTFFALTPIGHAQSGFAMSGPAHNVTVGKVDTVRIQVNKVPRGVYMADGVFNGKQLFGKFEVPGRRIDTCTPRHVCLFFTGAIDLSGEYGGWPTGTQTTFTMSIDVQPGMESAVGAYHIGPLSGFDFTQHGTLDLKVQTK